ncbi:MAG TPA: biopolymer transporter ExbD [Gemmatimonadaceae bacterium]|nr:biopolymer transporter ExbD [Gemmatimonadaceae bacterium]
MRRRRTKDQMHLNAEINVVSLIDVMMLLLVIFMLTAPMMTGGMDINLPEADAKPIEATGGMTVSIDRNGRIFLDDIELPLDRFKSVFASRARRSIEKTVKFQIDGDVRWELQSQVLAAINAAGITSVGYVFNPVTEPGR